MNIKRFLNASVQYKLPKEIKDNECLTEDPKFSTVGEVLTWYNKRLLSDGLEIKAENIKGQTKVAMYNGDFELYSVTSTYFQRSSTTLLLLLRKYWG